MKLNNFTTPNARIQKPEKIKIKNLLISEKIYLQSFKKLGILTKLTSYTRLEPKIKSGRTTNTIKPMLGRTYRSVRFLLDSIKTIKKSFSKKINAILAEPTDAHILKRKFQNELLEARLNLRIRRKRKQYIKKNFSPLRPPHWFKFRTKSLKRMWINSAKIKNLSTFHRKIRRKLARRFVRLKRRAHQISKLSRMKNYTNKRWLAIYKLRFLNS